MDGWRPRLREAIDLRELPLGAEDGFVLSRLDGATSFAELRALTSLPVARLQQILQRLVALGVVLPPPAGTRTPVPTSPVPLVAPVADGGAAAKPDLGRGRGWTSPVPPEAPGAVGDATAKPDLEAGPPRTSPVPAVAPVVSEASSTTSEGGPASASLASEWGTGAAASPSAPESGAPSAGMRSASEGGAAAVVMASGADAADDAAQEGVPTTARALFGQHLRHLDEAERVARASQAKDPELSAFCFDPLATVARALLGNPQFNLHHARMLSRFHTSPPGLEALAGRGGLVRDPVVERCLLRNPRLPIPAARRMLGSWRLLKLWLLHVDREVPELTRKTAKEVLRQRFGSAPAEERVDLILRTDGRVLISLGGIPVDGRTASLLCQRTYRSPLLILNLAKWSACPPQLLVHLWKQSAVRHQLQLRQALLRHPNLPSEFKREAS